MGASFSDRMSGVSYRQARRILLVTGLAVLGAVALVTYARRVDTVEVVATLLFLPIFVAFVYRGVVGGVVSALAAIAIYAAMRSPAIDAVGVGEFTGLLVSRSAAYLIFGLVGGWSTQVLEGSLDKLELYDEIDDETGLYNARHLVNQSELEMARARRYQTLFSLVVVDLPVATFGRLPARARRGALRDLARQLRESVRTVDHVVHVRIRDAHRLVVILPETAAAGSEVFRVRLEEQLRHALVTKGVTLDSTLETRSLTYPGDDDALEAFCAEVAEVDAARRPATP